MRGLTGILMLQANNLYVGILLVFTCKLLLFKISVRINELLSIWNSHHIAAGNSSIRSGYVMFFYYFSAYAERSGMFGLFPVAHTKTS